jgi:uncharacterized membrane protein (GlpM family)
MVSDSLTDILVQIVLPFFLSAMIVVGVTVLAERLGTKVGGILGTLPHLIIIAFVFIALNKGEDFASRAAVVVPAEIGINILFLFTFAHYCHHSLARALMVSLSLWLILSGLLVWSELSSMPISFLVFLACWGFTYYVTERVKTVRSVGSVKVKYTPRKVVGRGVLAGIVIAFSVVMSNVGSAISGIFSVFPAMFLSAMVISLREHGPDFAGGLSKAMVFGTPAVMSYGVCVHYLYPELGLLVGTVASTVIAVGVGLTMLALRNRIA